MGNHNKKIIFILPALSISFILGILAAQFTNIPFFVLFFLSIILFITCLYLKNDKTFSINLLGLVFFLGAAHMSCYQVLPKNHIDNHNVLFWADSFLVRGIVISEPQIKQDRTKFELNILEIEDEQHKQRVAGKVLVTDFGKNSVSYGDKLILEGQFFKPRNFGAKSNFNYKTYLKRKGIYGLLNVKKDAHFKIAAHNKANPVKYLAVKLKQKIEKGFYDNLPQVQASVLSAMLLGDRSDLPAQVREVFIRTGTAHILAISGLHTGIVTFILLVFLKTIRISRKPRYILTITLLIFYCLVTGARPSVVRAVIMAVVVLVGLLLEREVNVYNSLGLAALIILSYNPYQLQDVGFQLSFISVLSIIYLSGKIEKLLPKRNILVKSFSVSLSAWLGTSLLILYYFKIVTPITVLANLIIVPFVSLVIVTGFILLFSIFLLPSIVSFFALTAGSTIFLLVKSAQLLSLIPGAYFYVN